jgi:hypothetical protein
MEGVGAAGAHGQHASPSVQQGSPSVQQGSPSVQHASPSVQHASPSVQQGRPSVQHASPSVQHARPSEGFSMPMPPVSEERDRKTETAREREEASGRYSAVEWSAVDLLPPCLPVCITGITGGRVWGVGGRGIAEMRKRGPVAVAGQGELREERGEWGLGGGGREREWREGGARENLQGASRSAGRKWRGGEERWYERERERERERARLGDPVHYRDGPSRKGRWEREGERDERRVRRRLNPKP